MMLLGKKKDTSHVRIDFNNRPIVAMCVCGEILRGRNGTLPADRIYRIKGHLYCQKCAYKWFDYEFEVTDYL